MPSKEAAKYIGASLATGERREDFEYMLDSLTRMRNPFHPDTTYEAVEHIAGRLICLLVTPKPPRYRTAMQSFRLFFNDVDTDNVKKAEFFNSILPAALMVSTESEIVYRPSLYFSHPLIPGGGSGPFPGSGSGPITFGPITFGPRKLLIKGLTPELPGWY